MDETFILSNIAPQVGDGFNRHCEFATAMLVYRSYLRTLDWAYLERWCRDLTLSFTDVYIFTIPLYLPKIDADGKWRVVCLSKIIPLFRFLISAQKYEVIGNPPNIAVPTHFAKVVLTTRPASPSKPHITEISTGAFVLPNASIPHDTSLTGFVVPVEAVEKAAGLQLFSDDIKRESKHICQTAQCEVQVRLFDDAQKQLGKDKKAKAIAAPGPK